MPLVKNTETGNHYLVKINTDGDACSRTAIRSYDKQRGDQGDPGNKVYTLPFLYEPASHTLWVYVNGQKAEYEPTMSGTEQLLQYDETDVSEVTFQVGLENNDIIEFIVAGNYDGVGDGGIAPDLSEYLRRDGGNTFTGSTGPLSFVDNENIILLTDGVNEQDSVNHRQVFEEDDYSLVHKHKFLYDTVGLSPIINTSNGSAGVDVTNHKISNLANGAANSDGVNLGQLNTKVSKAGDTMTGVLGMSGHKIINVADGVVGATSKEAVNGSQLYSLPTIERISPVTAYQVVESNFTYPSPEYNAFNIESSVFDANDLPGVTVPSWARGLMFRVYLQVDQQNPFTVGDNAVYSEDRQHLRVSLHNTTPTTWDQVSYANNGRSVKNTEQINWNDVFAITHPNGSSKYRVKITYNDNALDQPLIPPNNDVVVAIWLIGWYR